MSSKPWSMDGITASAKGGPSINGEIKPSGETRGDVRDHRREEDLALGNDFGRGGLGLMVDEGVGEGKGRGEGEDEAEAEGEGEFATLTFSTVASSGRPGRSFSTFPNGNGLRVKAVPSGVETACGVVE